MGKPNRNNWYGEFGFIEFVFSILSIGIFFVLFLFFGWILIPFLMLFGQPAGKKNKRRRK